MPREGSWRRLAGGRGVRAFGLAMLVAVAGVSALAGGGDAVARSRSSTRFHHVETENQAVDRLMQSGRLNEAEAEMLTRIKEDGQQHGPTSVVVHHDINTLGFILIMKRDFSGAEAAFKRSVGLGGDGKPDHAEQTAMGQLGLGVVYQAQQRYADAETQYKECLTGLTRIDQGASPRIGQVLDTMAGLYTDEGRYRDAGKLYRQSLAILRKTLGRNSGEVGATLVHQAHLLVQQGKVDRAIKTYRRSIKILKKAKDPHPSTLVHAYGALGKLNFEKGDYGEAETNYKAGIAVASASKSPETDLDHIVCLGGLLETYKAEGRTKDAETLGKQLAAIAADRLKEARQQLDAMDKPQPHHEAAHRARARRHAKAHQETAPSDSAPAGAAGDESKGADKGN